MTSNDSPKAAMHTASAPSDPAASQGARRATGDAAPSAAPAARPGTDSEVVARARRRHFSNAEKRRILEAADGCSRPGEVGAPMRREGVYSSSLSSWRRQPEAAELAALAPQKRGPKVDASRAETLHTSRNSPASATASGAGSTRRCWSSRSKKTCRLVGQLDGRQRRQALMTAVDELTPSLGAVAASRRSSSGTGTVHRHSGIGYMTAAQRPRRPRPGAAPCPPGHPRCRIPGTPRALQGPPPATARDAHRSLD